MPCQTTHLNRPSVSTIHDCKEHCQVIRIHNRCVDDSTSQSLAHTGTSSTHKGIYKCCSQNIFSNEQPWSQSLRPLYMLMAVLSKHLWFLVLILRMNNLTSTVFASYFPLTNSNFRSQVLFHEVTIHGDHLFFAKLCADDWSHQSVSNSGTLSTVIRIEETCRQSIFESWTSQSMSQASRFPFPSTPSISFEQILQLGWCVDDSTSQWLANSSTYCSICSCTGYFHIWN